MDCLNGLKNSLDKKERALEESHIQYKEMITHKASQVKDQQQERLKRLVSQKSVNQLKVANQWLFTKRKLSSDRAVWASRFVCFYEFYLRYS